MLTLTSDLIVALRDQYSGFPPDCDHGVIVQALKIDSPAYRFVAIFMLLVGWIQLALVKTLFFNQKVLILLFFSTKTYILVLIRSPSGRGI